MCKGGPSAGRTRAPVVSNASHIPDHFSLSNMTELYFVFNITHKLLFYSKVVTVLTWVVWFTSHKLNLTGDHPFIVLKPRVNGRNIVGSCCVCLHVAKSLTANFAQQSQQHATGLWQKDVHTDVTFNIQQRQAVVGQQCCVRGMHRALGRVNSNNNNKNLYSANSIQCSNALHNKITQWETGYNN